MNPVTRDPRGGYPSRGEPATELPPVPTGPGPGVASSQPTPLGWPETVTELLRITTAPNGSFGLIEHNGTIGIYIQAYRPPQTISHAVSRGDLQALLDAYPDGAGVSDRWVLEWMDGRTEVVGGSQLSAADGVLTIRTREWGGTVVGCYPIVNLRKWYPDGAE